MGDTSKSDAVVVEVEDGDLRQPLVNEDAPEGANQGEEEAVPKGRGWLANLLTGIPIGLLVIGAVFCLAAGLVAKFIVFLGGGALLWAAGGVGLGGSFIAGIWVCSLGGMKYQLDRFKKENDRLHATSMKLDHEVTTLESTNQQLSVQVDQLGETIDDLQGVSEDLQGQLGNFTQLRESMEQFAKETGCDVKKAIGNVNNVYDKIFGLSVQNEKALLQRIAADLEFLDRDAAFSKEEFERFLQRIPAHLRDRFNVSGMSFESVAGADRVIDHNEMADLIDKLLEENVAKMPVN